MSNDEPTPADAAVSAAPPELLISRAEALQRWEVAAGEIETALHQDLVVAFTGSASAGKDSAIRALFGLDFGQIDPIPGSTAEVRVARLDAAGQVLLVNAPGFGDIRASVDTAARKVLDRADVFVYLVNCDGGATIDERRDLDLIRALGRPVLVCLNKIDLIRAHQQDAFVKTTLLQLGVAPEDAVVTAFDPMPALAEEPIGVQPVIGWIHQTLARQGKGLLFAKHLRSKVAACEPVIQSAAKKAAIAGSIPVPGADMAAITAIQVRMVSDIAAIFGARMDQDVALFLVGELLAGSSKGVVRWAVSALKAAGWIPGGQMAEVAASAIGASVASATTYGVGRATITYLQNGADMTGEELRAEFGQHADTWHQRVRAEARGDVVDVDATDVDDTGDAPA